MKTLTQQPDWPEASALAIILDAEGRPAGDVGRFEAARTPILGLVHNTNNSTSKRDGSCIMGRKNH